jgi:hypothetical protein
MAVGVYTRSGRDTGSLSNTPRAASTR